MTKSKCRQEFEKWCNRKNIQYPLKMIAPNVYADIDTKYAFLSWCAAWEATSISIDHIKFIFEAMEDAYRTLGWLSYSEVHTPPFKTGLQSERAEKLHKALIICQVFLDNNQKEKEE